MFDNFVNNTIYDLNGKQDAFLVSNMINGVRIM